MFGEKWPLKQGWLARIGKLKITPVMAQQVLLKLQKRAEEDNQYTARAIDIMTRLSEGHEEQNNVKDAIQMLRRAGYTVKRE